MQRWVRLPNGGFLDATQVMFIGKIDSYPRMDDEGNAAGVEFAVAIGTGFSRDQQLTVSGSKEDIATLVRQLLGQAAAQ
ncbi:MAG: hypothetical protein IT479_04860 [Xanthomonadales bacterium]|nr:hypothetical protein [Xanthomonadales bacterium]MCC6592586.1 hypothetical protein [Xanthomonadales bacterium]MCE7931671.1 hypothetical protein [Xanthomonadales bacterium PRO6]